MKIQSSTERVGVTQDGRPIGLVGLSSSGSVGADPQKLRVLLFAQQHGDEPSGKEALLMLLGKAFSGKLNDVIAHVDLLVVPQLNPEGNALRQRRTAHGHDLNRDHVLLSCPETRSLHQVFHTYRPHVTVDLHEYRSFSSEWAKAGIIRTADVQMGMLTNLNTSLLLRRYQRDAIFPAIAAGMRRKGYRFHEYIVGTPSTGVRHSTTENNDGRQSFGMFNTLSFVQEGRKWKGFDDRLEQRALSQLASLESLLEFCMNHADETRRLVDAERDALVGGRDARSVVRMEHRASGASMLIPGVHPARQEETLVTLSPYLDSVEPLKDILVPSAYVVPGHRQDIVELLTRHHVECAPVQSSRDVDASAYRIAGVRREVLEDEYMPCPDIDIEPLRARLRPGDVIVPTRQLHRHWLTTLFEPESMWNLGRYDQYKYLLHASRYPVLRLN